MTTPDWNSQDVEALKFKHEITESQSTVARVMRENGLIHKQKRNPQGLTKADKEVQKSEDLIKRYFESEEPNQKWVTDITQLTTADEKRMDSRNALNRK